MTFPENSGEKSLSVENNPGGCRNCIIAATFCILPIVGRGKRKNELPRKICPRCLRPFAWRKKWERCWAEVRYCSAACRKGTPRGGRNCSENPETV